ncbi:MAG: hypothetical protein RIG63_18410 [Coleofasciculus chthonoplastes F3-SA18-01]|uniref:hypothetical protein n=1 Tax=Coleofasciculus chthonoplastes TaxID=64178 RepID=UPI0033040FE9
MKNSLAAAMGTPRRTFRQFTPVLLSVALCWTTLACQDSTNYSQSVGQQNTNTVSSQTRLTDGKYPLQQVTYNDANGQYTLFLMNYTGAAYSTTNPQMIPLTPEELNSGEQSYLKMQNNQAVLHLSPEFQIEYIHAVTEPASNNEMVIVREESTYWQPFESDGEIEIELEFHSPRYYIPPPYQSGAVLHSGYHASSYDQAVAKYQSSHDTPPPAVRNNQLRTSGVLRKSTTSQTTTPRTSPASTNSSSTTPSTPTDKSTTPNVSPGTTNSATTTQSAPTSTGSSTSSSPSSSSSKTTGSGYGSSNLRQSSQSKPKSSSSRNRSSSFGSSSSRSSGSKKKR